MNGGFTVKQRIRKCSAIPVDQALEKEYNKNAKESSGINRFTREKKEVVAKSMKKCSTSNSLTIFAI